MLSLLSLAMAVPYWNWPETPVLYHGETRIVHGYGLVYEAATNEDAVAHDVSMVMDTRCSAKIVDDVRMVNCTFDWFRIQGTAMKAEEQTELNGILQEWSATIKDYRVEMVFGMDGKMRQFDLENVDRVNQRTGFIIERQRLLLLRIFCLLDFPIPQTEQEWAKGWRIKGWVPAFSLINTTGTAGSMRLLNTPREPRNGYQYIESEGRGMVNTGSGLDNGSGAMIDCNLGGATLFDEKTGLLAWRTMVLDGQYTASAGMNANVPYYQQVAAIQRVDAFEPEGKSPPPLAAAP